MNTYEPGDYSFPMDMSRQQMTVVTELFRAVTTMYHVDELFQWLAYAIVQHLDVQLLQFWTNSVNRTGQLAVQLRTIVSQDPSLPQRIVVNDHVALVVQRVAQERSIYNPQPIKNMFSQYQSVRLKRYGLYYCGGCFMSTNVLLPPPDDPLSHGNPTALFALMPLVFLQHIPHPDLVTTIGVILKQAIAIAEDRGLLLPAAANSPQQSSPLPVQVPLPQQASPPGQAELIPRRKQDASAMLASNPFARTTIIVDKQARRLYTAIDGRSNVADLCNATGLSLKEAYEALQKLLVQQRIELYESGGQLVNASSLFNNR